MAHRRQCECCAKEPNTDVQYLPNTWCVRFSVFLFLPFLQIKQPAFLLRGFKYTNSSAGIRKSYIRSKLGIWLAGAASLHSAKFLRTEIEKGRLQLRLYLFCNCYFLAVFHL